jgi:hypothetical protein
VGEGKKFKFIVSSKEKTLTYLLAPPLVGEGKKFKFIVSSKEKTLIYLLAPPPLVGEGARQGGRGRFSCQLQQQISYIRQHLS